MNLQGLTAMEAGGIYELFLLSFNLYDNLHGFILPRLYKPRLV